MFPKNQRLSLTKQFWNQKKLVWRHLLADFYYLPEQSEFKVVVIISKKIDKRARYRNYYRRKLLHLLKQTLIPDQSIHLVIKIKPKYVHASLADIDQLLRLFNQQLKDNGKTAIN